MRLLQIHNRYAEPGGEDTSVELELEMLRQNGYEVRRVTPRNSSHGLEAALQMSMSVSNPAARRQMQRLVAAWRPDIAHVNNTWYRLSPAVVQALGREGVPIVVTLRNYRLFCIDAGLFRAGRPCTDCLGRGPWRGVAHACYRGSRPTSAMAAMTIATHRLRHTWDHVARFLAISDQVREVAILGGLPAEKISVVPNVSRDPGERDQPPSASNEVIYAGRLDERKGVSALVDAWEANRDVLQGLKLVLIGQGPLAAELKVRSGRDIDVMPWLDPPRLAARLLDARGLVCPSRWEEPFGRVVVEGLGAGLPTIVSNHGGLPEIVRPVDPDLIVEDDSGEAWRRSLERLNDASWVDRRGRAGRAHFEAEFTLERGRRRLAAVYDSVLAEGGRGSTAGDASRCSTTEYP